MIIRPYALFARLEDEMTETSPVSETPSARYWTLPRVRVVAAIALLGSMTVGVVMLIVLLVSLYPSLRVTAQNLERVSEAMAVSAENLAGVSDETALNLAETSANLNEAAANINNASANFEGTSLEDSIAETIIRLLEQSEQINGR